MIVRKIHDLPFYKITKQSNKKYQTYIEKHLHQLNKILEQKNIKLILSPIIHPKFGQIDFEKKFFEAINLHNQSIISVAENLSNVELFYPKKIFEDDQNTHFLDCCHFSEIGSKLYSNALSIESETKAAPSFSGYGNRLYTALVARIIGITLQAAASDIVVDAKDTIQSAFENTSAIEYLGELKIFSRFEDLAREKKMLLVSTGCIRTIMSMSGFSSNSRITNTTKCS